MTEDRAKKKKKVTVLFPLYRKYPKGMSSLNGLWV